MADTVNTNEKDLLFVSWTNRDGLGKELGEAFTEFFDSFELGIEVFYSNRDLGSDWYHVLNENLQRAKFAVFCITPKAVNSEWVNYELGSILNNRVQTCDDVKKRVFPIQLSNTDRINRDKTPFAHNNVKKFCADELKQLIDCLFTEYILKNNINAIAALEKQKKVNKIFELAFEKLQKQVEEILAKEKPEEGLKSEIIELRNKIKVIQTPIQTPSSVEHPVIDLGLPSGRLWAAYNIGSTSPWDENCSYFALGETETKDTYSWGNYKYCNDGDKTKLTKYCYDEKYGYNGFTDNRTKLSDADDAATVNWGSDWRMPTVDDFKELYDNCENWWDADYKEHGVPGRVFKSKKAEIFFPAVGRKGVEGKTLDAGSSGGYWSSSLHMRPPYFAQYLYFYSDGAIPDNWDYRYLGFPVRAVRRKN